VPADADCSTQLCSIAELRRRRIAELSLEVFFNRKSSCNTFCVRNSVTG
jgi:hypothetical protein